LALDLTIRAETQGKKSLDDVMRALWKKFGKDFYDQVPNSKQQGLGEQEFEVLVEQVTGLKIKRFIDKYIKGTEDLPLATLYTDFGVQVADQNASKKASLNVRVGQSGTDCKLAHVYENGAAHKAGLSANDVLIAMNGLRVTAADAANGLSRILGAYSVGETVQIHAFRRDELLILNAKLQADDAPNVSLSLSANQKLALSKKRPSI
jgi:predicted metalloprotease with PDZ domain